MWPTAVGALALLTLALGVYWGTRPPEETPSTTPAAVPVAQVEVVQAPAHVVPEPVPPVAPPTPAIVTLSIGSSPPNAQVWQGETQLCTTPCLEDFAEGEALVLTFRHAGYQDAVEHVQATTGATISPRLRARRQVSGDESAGGSVAIKTTL